MSQEQLDIMSKEIQQIREEYNAKLQAATATAHSQVDVTTTKNEMITDFESVLNYEFEKILLSLRMKSQNMSQDQLNEKRNQINRQIQKLLFNNRHQSLKKAMDHVKKKISDVLKLFKDSLEEKNRKKVMELEKRVEQLAVELKLKHDEAAQLQNANHTLTLMSEQIHTQDDLIPQKYISSSSKRGETIRNSADMQTLNAGDSHILEKLEP